MGVDEVDGGPGFILWVGLLHKPSQKRCLFINVHPTHGYEAAEPNDLKGNSWRDWAAGNYWLRVLQLTTEQLQRRADDRATTMARFWDVVELGGDLNGDLLDSSEWYYPARTLTSCYQPDVHQLSGLDHLLQAHGSDTELVKRWSKSARTDHRLHFATYRLASVGDYPPEQKR